MSKPSFDRLSAAFIALIAWSGLILQYVLLVEATRDNLGVALATLRFFSFFTILSNLLVALIVTFAAIGTRSMREAFLARLRGAAALCIGITCAIYFFVLASLWSPQGAQLLADVTMHYIVPGMYLLWWLLGAPHRQLRWSDALRWLLVPLAYLIWVLLRGAWLHEYPYPFLDVDTLGAAVVARNCVGVALLFLLFGLVLVGLDRRIGSADPDRAP
jgi:hypothetical protein